MSHAPVTPRKASGEEAPSAPTRLASAVLASSPHYTTTRRHSLYGTEDRIVIDPGLLVWKIGFSGESRPRDVFYAGAHLTKAVCSSFDKARTAAERDENERMLEVLLQAQLRNVFFESLLTDPKSRKVIIVEHPLLPLAVKETMARILFNNLQVPSLSFVSSHLLALLAVGRISGLVLDCGYYETTALPIFSSRPLYPHLRTTPLAGMRLSSHLRSLLLLFGTWLPPPTSLGGPANIPNASRATTVPEEVLSDELLEEITTRCLFVAQPLPHHLLQEESIDAMSVDDSTAPSEIPPSEPDSYSQSVPPSSSPVPSSSDFAEVNVAPGAETSGGRKTRLQTIANLYMRHSTATDIVMHAIPPPAQRLGTGRGTLVIPGWIRERAAEVLFEGHDVDESSVAEVLLDSLLKTPVDLRKHMATNIVVSGGTAMLPGFIPRLHQEILHRLEEPYHSPSSSKRPLYDPYASLRPLGPIISILNNPQPPVHALKAGKAPAFTPAILPWLGGSLAGALKTGGEEITRERWDEADIEKEDVGSDDDEEAPVEHVVERVRQGGFVLPDWTKTPLPLGAPSVFTHTPAVSVA
ncbi:actin-like ATPase domain-containing protein [Exidia glandulosa HHB12029]|uniref:Actin-like ATPase domain-containing protein n=1 Tax=Exidia glandulosa HHB12029 TaxID=1314781 RepID=A0A165JE98_EXIGL|nr:actin-like ATPase domain-containing protein [Exidia glandulosa HHB12029]